MHLLRAVGGVVGTTSFASRPAGLSRLSRGTRRATRWSVAAHLGELARDGFEPVFQVLDVERSLVFYQKLGFETSMHDEAYAIAHRARDLRIHLARAEQDSLPGHGSLYIHRQDADRVAEEWRRAGIVVNGPEDQDYGKREGTVVDPDGNAIRFGSPCGDLRPGIRTTVRGPSGGDFLPREGPYNILKVRGRADEG